MPGVIGPSHPATPTGYPAAQNTWAQSTNPNQYPNRLDVRKKSFTAAQAAAASGTAVHAAVADTGVAQTISTGITNPPCARTITATPSGTTGNVTAVQMILTGLDIAGNPQTEIMPAFTSGAATAVTSAYAYSAITSYIQPACGTSVSIALGFGNALGLDDLLTENSVLHASLNGVKETTAPTVLTSSTVLGGNTVKLNSSLNGTPVSIYYVNG